VQLFVGRVEGEESRVERVEESKYLCRLVKLQGRESINKSHYCSNQAGAGVSLRDELLVLVGRRTS
jgi:hypothetical protein